MTATEATGGRLERRSPLGPLGAELRSRCSGPAFRAEEDAFRTLTELRCGPSAVGEVERRLGMEPPGLRQAAPYDDGWVVSLGPSWWLVDAPEGASPVAGSAGLSAVDVSAQRVAVDLAGPGVLDVLAGGCALDLDPEVFAIGAAASTVLASAGIVLVRTGENSYRLWVRTSFARYLATWLLDAASPLVDPPHTPR